jgi:hypothetical protein
VLIPTQDILTFDKHAPVAMKRVGISRATTFAGFCARHDNLIFSLIDTKPIAPSQDQLLLLAYRTWAQRVHQLLGAVDMMEFARGIYGGPRTSDPRLLWSRAQTNAAHVLLENAVYHMNAYERILFNDADDFAISIKVEIDAPPVALASFAHFFARGFDGTLLQDVSNVSTATTAVCCSMLEAANGHTLFLITWTGTNELPADFAASLAHADKTHLPSVLLRFVFENGRPVVSPAWWQTLTPEQQQSLLQASRNRGTDGPTDELWDAQVVGAIRFGNANKNRPNPKIR